MTRKPPLPGFHPPVPATKDYVQRPAVLIVTLVLILYNPISIIAAEDRFMSIIGLPPGPLDPSASGVDSAPTLVPSYALFNPTSVALATLLGSPVAGSILMVLNYRRLGKRGEGLRTLSVGVMITGLAIGLGYLMPRGTAPSFAPGLGLGMWMYAKTLQGSAVERHEREGGRLESRWKAAGIGIAVSVLTLAPIFSVRFIIDRTPK